MQYEKQKEKLLNDKSICKENKQLFKKFFEHEEYKLKRSNGLSKLDEGTYKTLYGYISKFRNINKWFRNKTFKEITKADMKRVYDGLEEGTILNSKGQPFKDRRSYYNKIFRSKLFQMVKKADLAREVMEFYKPNGDEEVRFVKEESVRKSSNVMINPKHKLLLWLSFDIGENINSLLRLTKGDCVRQTDEDTKLPEYRINLRQEILKRSRTPRSEITNYRETVEFLDNILKDLEDGDFIFNFKYRMAKKFLDRAVKITGVKCIPKGQPVTWKDLRSSMACDLLSKDWTTDEVNARLGHKPSSREIDKYITFMAIDRHKPKRKIYDHNISKLNAELEDSKEREKLHANRVKHLQDKLSSMEKDFDGLKKNIIQEIASDLKQKLRNST
jgi:hypothetical protein